MNLIIIAIIVTVISIAILVIGSLLTNSYNYDGIGFLLIVLGMVCTLLSLVLDISLFGIEGNNRELFLKMQQEYIVVSRYINSDKSDSILESQDMMNRIKEYNDTVIKKQNDLTRPIMKEYAKGANWNELKLIDLSELQNKE